MIETPQLMEVPSRLIACVALKVPREKIQDVMGPGLDELRAALATQGIVPTGPWFTHHLRMDPEVFDFEIALPVETPVAAVGRVRSGTLEAARVARTVYHGGFEGLGDAWGEFMDWIEGQGLTAAADLWETYTQGPESSPVPADWRTELTRPLVG